MIRILLKRYQIITIKCINTLILRKIKKYDLNFISVLVFPCKIIPRYGKHDTQNHNET